MAGPQVNTCSLTPFLSPLSVVECQQHIFSPGPYGTQTSNIKANRRYLSEFLNYRTNTGERLRYQCYHRCDGYRLRKSAAVAIEKSQDLSSKGATPVSSQETSVPANRAVIEKDWQREDLFSVCACMCVVCVRVYI